MSDVKLVTVNGHTREIQEPELTDKQVADRIRMLMRTDLDHERWCTAARDRIYYLSAQLAALSPDAEAMRKALEQLMGAYERRIRSDCKTPEDLTKEPWRCAEYVAAEQALGHVKLLFTNEWLRRRIAAEPDDASCEAGVLHPDAPRAAPPGDWVLVPRVLVDALTNRVTMMREHPASGKYTLAEVEWLRQLAACAAAPQTPGRVG